MSCFQQGLWEIGFSFWKDPAAPPDEFFVWEIQVVQTEWHLVNLRVKTRDSRGKRTWSLEGIRVFLEDAFWCWKEPLWKEEPLIVFIILRLSSAEVDSGYRSLFICGGHVVCDLSARTARSFAQIQCSGFDPGRIPGCWCPDSHSQKIIYRNQKQTWG